jgi:predicted ATPase
MKMQDIISRAEFVGREKELAFLSQRLDNALNNQGSLVIISAEAGMGKSRLIAEFARKAQLTIGVEVLAGSCLFYDAMPYLPFIEAFRGYFKITGVDPDTTARKIRNVLLNVSEDVAGLVPVVGGFLSIGAKLTRSIAAQIDLSELELDKDI